MSLTEYDILEALKRIDRAGSIPLRENSWNEYPFWADPINLTKARPVPGASGWLNYISVPTRPGYVALVRSFVGTSQVIPSTSGVEYRFIRRGIRSTPGEYEITNDIEKNLDRLEANPYPTTPRPTFFRVDDDEDFILQVRNTNANQQLAFAALYGWYYDALGTAASIQAGEGITDVSSI